MDEILTLHTGIEWLELHGGGYLELNTEADSFDIDIFSQSYVRFLLLELILYAQGQGYSSLALSSDDDLLMEAIGLSEIYAYVTKGDIYLDDYIVSSGSMASTIDATFSIDNYSTTDGYILLREQAKPIKITLDCVNYTDMSLDII